MVELKHVVVKWSALGHEAGKRQGEDTSLSGLCPESMSPCRVSSESQLLFFFPFENDTGTNAKSNVVLFLSRGFIEMNLEVSKKLTFSLSFSKDVWKVITIVTYFLWVKHWLGLDGWRNGSKMIEKKYTCSKAEFFCKGPDSNSWVICFVLWLLKSAFAAWKQQQITYKWMNEVVLPHITYISRWWAKFGFWACCKSLTWHGVY